VKNYLVSIYQPDGPAPLTEVRGPTMRDVAALVDEAKIEEASADVPTSGVRASLWGSRRGAGLFEVPPSEPEWPEE
jgi:hypothetical protein